jgi:hypothetical protein
LANGTLWASGTLAVLQQERRVRDVDLDIKRLRQ